VMIEWSFCWTAKDFISQFLNGHGEIENGMASLRNRSRGREEKQTFFSNPLDPADSSSESVSRTADSNFTEFSRARISRGSFRLSSRNELKQFTIEFLDANIKRAKFWKAEISEVGHFLSSLDIFLVLNGRTRPID
jgi:hypothetical protein